MLLFYGLAGERRPALWKILGFTAILSVYVLLISLGFQYVPEQYLWVSFVLIALLAPFGQILNGFGRRFTLKQDKSEPGGTSHGG